MKVSVDNNLCQGHARCFQFCPEVFDLDDEGFAVVLLDDIPPGLEASVHQAVVNCPERAITVNE